VLQQRGLTVDEIDEGLIERLCLMTVDGGKTDEQALRELELEGSIYEQWLAEHPIDAR